MDTRSRVKRNLNNNTKLILKYSCKRNCNTTELVFDKVFAVLNFQDLKWCRLVCKNWKDIAKAHIGECTLVRLNSKEKLESFLSIFQSQPILFKNVIIQGPMEMKGSFKQLFTIFGHSLKSLQIRNCNWMGKALFSIMEATPNLEALTLVGRVALEDRFYPYGWESVDNESLRIHWRHMKSLTLDLRGNNDTIWSCDPKTKTGNIQPFVYQLFLATPNIQEIIYPQNEPYFSRVVLHTMLFRNEVTLPKLKKLDMQSKITDFELRFLLHKNFPLSSFTLIVQPNVSLHVLHSLLTSLGSTLKVLNLKYVEREAVSSQYFPSSSSLVNLKELTLLRYNGSLMFLKDLICLERISVKDGYLQTLFSGPRGEPIIWPVGFVFDKSEICNGVVRGVRDRAFIPVCTTIKKNWN